MNALDLIRLAEWDSLLRAMHAYAPSREAPLTPWEMRRPSTAFTDADFERECAIREYRRDVLGEGRVRRLRRVEVAS